MSYGKTEVQYYLPLRQVSSLDFVLRRIRSYIFTDWTCTRILLVESYTRITYIMLCMCTMRVHYITLYYENDDTERRCLAIL